MPVYCSHCFDEIKQKSDLIVTCDLFTYNTYHAECYGLKFKRSGGFFIGRPINNHQGLLAPIGLLIIYLISLLYPSFRSEPVLHLIWAIFFICSTIPRLYSYYKFEKKLQ